MSLTRLLKEMKKLDNRASQLQLRYSSAKSSKAESGFNDLQSDEDKKIYGYCQADLLQSFKDRGKQTFNSKEKLFKKSVQIEQSKIKTKKYEFAHLRRSSAVNLGGNRENNKSIHQKRERKMSVNRPKTGFIKQQYFFLFKEDIFTPGRQLQQPTENTLQLKFNNLNRISKESQLSKKLQRGKFIRTFKQCVSRVQQEKIRKKQPWKGKTKVIYELDSKRINEIQTNKDNISKENHKNKETSKEKERKDNFFLTRIPIQNKKSDQLYFHQNQMSTLHQMQSILIDYPLYPTLTPIPSSPFLQNNFPASFPTVMTIYLIDTATLSICKLVLIKQTNGFWNQKDKYFNPMQIKSKALPKITEYIHVCIVEGEGFEKPQDFNEDGQDMTNIENFYQNQPRLIYEQFWSANMMSHYQSRQNQIFLLSYYLKRFLLFDQTIDHPTPINHSISLIVNNNLELPSQFLVFLPTFPQKMIPFISRCNKAITLSVRDILASGVSEMRGWKHEMGVGEKALVLKAKDNHKGGKDKQSKVMYNWEYFYICSSLSCDKYLEIESEYKYFDMIIGMSCAVCRE